MEVSFQQTVYTVMESGDVVEVCVVLSGVLERSVTITLSTSNGSATGKWCHSNCFVYCYYHLILYILFNKSFWP